MTYIVLGGTLSLTQSINQSSRSVWIDRQTDVAANSHQHPDAIYTDLYHRVLKSECGLFAVHHD